VGVAYETVKLVESGQHVSWTVTSAVQGDFVGIAEVVGLVVGEVDVASCIYMSALALSLHGDHVEIKILGQPYQSLVVSTDVGYASSRLPS
jgi:hypothetical protein